MDFKEHEASIVVVGQLNPAIFQPEWLAQHGLISTPDLDSTKIELIHPDIALFDLPWARIDVRQDLFSLRSKDAAYFPMLKDLAIGIFQLLEHTPVRAVGINSILQFIAKNSNEWHRVGNRLVPKNIWEQYYDGHVGMTRVSVTGEKTFGDISANLNITIAPVASSGINGVVVNINNHFDLKSTRELHNILSTHWEELQKKSRSISEQILDEASK
jgi:hypothetical protein